MVAHATLDGEGGVEGRRRLLEGGEELIAASVDLAAPGSLDGESQEAAKLAQQGSVPLAEPMQQLGRTLDVDQRERDLPTRQLLLRPELGAHETKGHDAELLGGPEESHPGLVTSRVVLEADAAEAGQRVAHVGLVVDRQHAVAPGVDVGEGAVRQA